MIGIMVRAEDIRVGDKILGAQYSSDSDARWLYVWNSAWNGRSRMHRKLVVSYNQTFIIPKDTMLMKAFES